MIKTEKLKFYEICKTKKPFDMGNSLHVYYEKYKIDGHIVTLYYAISGDDTEIPEIEVQTVEEFNQPSALDIFEQKLKNGEVDTSKFVETLKKLNMYQSRVLTSAEKKEILETYKWIKVARYKELDPKSSEDCDWKKEYFKLLEHHKKETEFLIKKVRELV